MHEIVLVLVILGQGAVFAVRWAFRLWLWWCALIFVVLVGSILIGKYWPKPGNKGREGG